MLSRLGVSGRLLLAFLSISALAMMGAAVAIYSFREIGDVLERITARRVPAALASQEVSRQAERIIAAAPALLAASSANEHGERSSYIATETQALVALLESLENSGADAVALGSMRALVSRLRINLANLDKLVANRIIVSEQKRGQLREALTVHTESQDLLAPWLQIVDGEIAQARRAVNDATLAAGDRATADRRLGGSIAAHQTLQQMQFLITSASERLQQLAASDDVNAVRVQQFRIQQGLGEARRRIGDLDARLRPLLAGKLDVLRSQVEGADSIPQLRLQELEINTQAVRHLTENTVLSRELTEAVDRLVTVAKRDIAQANKDAQSAERFSSSALVGTVALSLLASVLIVWLYVGRNIVRRLTRLSDTMLAIAAGSLQAPVAARGTDEIAAMGRAVEVFRKNTLERNELLA